MMYSQTFCCSTKVPLSFGIFGYASNACLMTYTNEMGWHGWVDSMLQFWFRLATRLFHFRKAHINHQTKSSSLPSPSPSRRQWKAKVFLKWALKTGCEERGLRYTCDLLKRAHVSLPLSLSLMLSLSVCSLENPLPERGPSHYSVEGRGSRQLCRCNAECIWRWAKDINDYRCCCCWWWWRCL